jgi:flagellar biosynthesis GTPase FlhF
MMYKSCPSPSDGGSAKGVTRYILGYELGAKQEEWEIRNASYHALITESLQRPDFGVGTVWSPAVGEGIRPSSILALNVGMLATADIEMQSLHQANKRTKSPAHHEVWAFGNDHGLSDGQALQAVRHAYERVGLGDAAMVMAVHRDTFHDDGRVMLHIHVARSGIDPKTLRSYNHHQIHSRMDRVSRAIEIEMGLFHDRGLAVVDRTIDGRAFVRDSTVPERIAWRRENREERIVALERSRYIDNALREGSFERYAEARIEPRLREVIDRAKDAGRPVQAIDLTNTAARLGTILQVGDGGSLQLRDLSTARLREKQHEEIAQTKAAHAGAKSLVREEALNALKRKHRAELTAETRRLLIKGEVAPLTVKMQEEIRKAVREPRIFADEIAIERAFVAAVDKDPGLVARVLTESMSTFGRDDVDRYLIDRISDVGEVERLGHKIFSEDTSLLLRSGDTDVGVWTTKEMLAIEQQIEVDAQALSQQPDRAFSSERRAAAIAAMEADRSTPEKPFCLSVEQRDALSKHGGLVVLLGNSGAGKTTIMEAIRRDAEATHRPIRGVTIAQAAALRLEIEAGFGCVNTAFALLADSAKRELIPRKGVLVIDEAGMVDSRTTRALLRIARERETVVVAIGDPRQIQAVGAGGAWRILEAAARKAGTFAELKENRRQFHEWHRRAVALVSHGIEQENAEVFTRAVKILEQNNALAFVPTKDDAIAEAVGWYEGERKKSDDVLLVASDRDSVRYLNEELLRRREERGFERRYLTEGGTRGLAIGDRFIFGENNRQLGIVNGDTGTVTRTGELLIGVRLDRSGDVIEFDARKYQVWDHGYATTISRAQGASVRALGGIVDGAATAEAFHVLIGRSKDRLRVLVPTTAFENASDLAVHLRDRIVAKGTSVDVGPQVAKRGGPETHYARNVAAQRMSAKNPSRQEYEREWTDLRNRRDLEIRNLAAEYRAKAAIANPTEGKRLRAEQRKAEAAIVKTYQAEDFGAWLHRKAERDDGTVERLEALNKRRNERGIEPAIAQTKARTHTVDPAVEQATKDLKHAVEMKPAVQKKSRRRRM